MKHTLEHTYDMPPYIQIMYIRVDNYVTSI